MVRLRNFVYCVLQRGRALQNLLQKGSFGMLSKPRSSGNKRYDYLRSTCLLLSLAVSLPAGPCLSTSVYVSLRFVSRPHQSACRRWRMPRRRRRWTWSSATRSSSPRFRWGTSLHTCGTCVCLRTNTDVRMPFTIRHAESKEHVGKTGEHEATPVLVWLHAECNARRLHSPSSQPRSTHIAHTH